MTNEINSIGSPVKDFVKSFFDGLEAGLSEKGYTTCPEIQSHAKMELTAIATVESGGEGGAKIVGIGGSLHTNDSDTSSQKITVFVKKINEVDQEEEKARVAIAKEKQSYAQSLVLGQIAYR